MHSVRQQHSAPSTSSTTAAGGGPRRPSHRGGGQNRPSRRRGRPRRRGWSRPVGVLVAVGLLGSVAYFLHDGRGETSKGASTGTSNDTVDGASLPLDTADSTSIPEPTPGATSAHGKSPASAGGAAFVTARAGGAKVGRGPHPLRYVVQLEKGIDISPTQAANEIADILAAPRGWTENHDFAFQLVGEGQPHDIKVVIATPKTADALCWAGIRQDTEGKYNCEIPGGVVVNLKRWVEGSPNFDGPIHGYRALIINHEMGHFLGYTHMACPGPGLPAPVMMQQIKSLHGCVANAWPYDDNGNIIAGPHVN
ncbi:DUF3152 domain-containing protein [Streptomyces sp. NPDC086787]|uniref:DUF3152 domain-containing protein n=1 Tax=Streptomyces sp. NPDC086787 TaxID=3365759 RepID=UPI00380A7D93